MNSEILDERYSVADEAICDAFLLLLGEKEMDRITVSDVVKKAGIVRSTFYNHYENIPALVSAIEDRTIREIFSLMASFHPKNDRDMCRSYFLAICRYTQTNPFLSRLLSDPRGDAFFEKTITMLHLYVTQVTQDAVPSRQQSKEEFSYLVACAIGSTIGVLHKWSRENFRTPAGEIASLLARSFIAGVLPFMQ